MYHSNFHTKIILFNIFNQLKHIPLKALVAEWIHPFIKNYGENIYIHIIISIRFVKKRPNVNPAEKERISYIKYHYYLQRIEITEIYLLAERDYQYVSCMT